MVIQGTEIIMGHMSWSQEIGLYIERSGETHEEPKQRRQIITAAAAAKSLQSCPTLCDPTPWTAAYQAPRSVGFSRQEYWSGVPLPSPIRYYKPVLKAF